MDYFSPIVGTVTGIEMAQWKDLLLFGLKVFLFTVPFVVIGLLVEKDIIKVPVPSRVIKTLIIFCLSVPVFLFGVLNYMAPGMSDPFWEKYPFLEGLWIMEGTWPPIILSGLVMLYLLAYVVEILRGDMSS